MKDRGHVIKEVINGSIAEEMEIEAGDILLEINGEKIEDIFDYQFQCEDEFVTVLIRKPDGSEWELEIDKEMDEDLGIVFESGLMDDYKSCRNKCIFCFIDQMPKGMRETLYFKDDDSRLSFLQGNYITLTNMEDHDIDRIIRYNLSPINISFQTTNPKLRCMMLNNRFAGEALEKVKKLNAAGITMNGQIVLCKGINDGEELERSIRDLTEYIPNLASVSVVPVGLSNHRAGLYELKPFEKQDAIAVIDLITKWQQKIYEEYGYHFIHASDEFYLMAGYEMPAADTYDGYLQLENGVGMVRLFLEEFGTAKESLLNMFKKNEVLRNKSRKVSFATGLLFYPILKKCVDEIVGLMPNLSVNVYGIRNDFFGDKITVAGLLTGKDIYVQLKGQELFGTLYLPETLLRYNEDVLLDDITVSDLQKSLQVDIDIVKSSGRDLMESIIGERVYE